MATSEGTRLSSNSQLDPRWGVALRTADSPGFRNCPKLRAFLLYVCENTLLGQPDNIREQLIGSKVFGRPVDYNLREDNIVRVEARELRKRLETHFATDGRSEPFIIEIPKGGYVPVFRAADPPKSGAPEPAPDERSEIGEAALRTGSRRFTALVPVLVAGLLLSGGALAWMAMENVRLRQSPPHPAGAQSGAALADYSCYRDLLGALAGAQGRETLLVLSNPKVVLHVGLDLAPPAGTPPAPRIPVPKGMEEQLSSALNNLDRNRPYHFLIPSPTEYTGMGEAVSAFHLARLLQFLHTPVRLTQGRFLNWDHVHKQNLIVLGSPHINDWTYRNTMNSIFALERWGVGNPKPLPGESARYERSQGGQWPSGDGTDYAVIKMLNPPYDIRMLLLAGVSSASTAGAGEFFATPEKMKKVRDRIRAAVPTGPFPSTWEIVLRVEVRDGFPAETDAIAVRPAPGAR